jgi:hypothetical protein
MVDKRELYRSSNGDAWFLARESDGRVFVIHEPNAPSGGRVSQIELGAFLREGANGPEHQALRRLIGTLVEVPSFAYRSWRAASTFSSGRFRATM